MAQRILILGAGFAGVWSALAAARVADIAGKSDELEIIVLAPEPRIGIRPRFYESDLSGVSAPLLELFQVTGISFVKGKVEEIDAAGNTVTYLDENDTHASMQFDRLVLATGSNLAKPNIPGINQFTFNNDQLSEALRLQRHLEDLASRPSTRARNTVVIAGGGFTGIETAAELPTRLRSILGEHEEIEVVIVERADAIGPDLGPAPRPVIEQALRELGVKVRLGAAVSSIDETGVRLADGSHIQSDTVIWTAGLQSNALTAQIPADRDRLGRLHVAADLKVIGQEKIFAAGDTAFAATDGAGNHTMMSCQHASNLGRSAGHNVAADLLGEPAIPYDQINYVTCLDLGPWGAVLTEGWDRKVKLVGKEAKKLKREINTVWIYPPKADRAEAFSAADPTRRFV
jgi:NADH dehydrogenase